MNIYTYLYTLFFVPLTGFLCPISFPQKVCCFPNLSSMKAVGGFWWCPWGVHCAGSLCVWPWATTQSAFWGTNAAWDQNTISNVVPAYPFPFLFLMIPASDSNLLQGYHNWLHQSLSGARFFPLYPVLPSAWYGSMLRLSFYIHTTDLPFCTCQTSLMGGASAFLSCWSFFIQSWGWGAGV
jgi:hypothetical protein